MTWYMAAFRLEWLAMALLLVSATMALAARRKGLLVRWVFPCVVIGGLALWALAALGLALYLRLGKETYPHWLYHDLARALAFFAGAGVILWRGSRPAGSTPDTNRAAGAWPLPRLFKVSAAAALIWGATLWAFCAHAAGQFEAARRDARALAVSVKPPAVAEEANAAMLYKRACELIPNRMRMSEADAREHSSWSFSWGWDEAADPRMLAYLERMQPALELLEQAAVRPGCRFNSEHDYSHPGLQEFTYDRGILRAKSLLRMNVRRRCIQGDARGALGSVAGLHTLASHIAQEPAYSRVTQAIGMYHPWVLEYVLARTSPSSEDLKILPKIGDAALDQRFRAALILEEALALSEMAMVEEVAFARNRITGDEPVAVMLFGKLGFRLCLIGWRTFYLAPDLADFRSRMKAARDLAARPFLEVQEEWRQWDRNCLEEPHGVMTGLFLPAAGRLALNVCRGTAQIRLTDMALAAAAYRAEHGRYPVKAGDIVPTFIPAIPQDPFDGQPLRMRAVDGELLLYSVGEDGKDDGGAEMNHKQHTGDITFCLGTKLWRERRAESVSGTDKAGAGKPGVGKSGR
ncbi:MAG TPA: hypothetical protein PK280_10690 [Planctomycetota bacterium]|nr:hypothetical protein [Planctomycetota bacterium]